MVASTFQKKGHKIGNVGYTPALCGTDRAVAFEVNSVKTHIEDHTIATTSASNMFAKYERGVIRGGSCGCGHLNQFLAAVLDGAETMYTDLCDAGETKYSWRVVSKGNEKFEKAIQNGIVWFMIKWEVERDYPELPNIIQRGLNVEHHVGEGAFSIYKGIRV